MERGAKANGSYRLDARVSAHVLGQRKLSNGVRLPELPIDTAVQLNDRYELDGRDPNGYAGIAWAVAGKHDRAWGPERLGIR